MNDDKMYQLTAEQVAVKLNTRFEGLTYQDAEARLKQYGPNALEYGASSVVLRFLRQFNNPLVYILLIAAVITGVLTLLGEHMLTDMVVILGVVMLNAILGFVQEGKTEKTLEALRNMIVLECTVIRDGEQKVVPARSLVPGDVVILNAGDKVPADMRLFYTRNASVDESTLTGESVPVEKSIEEIVASGLSPGDQRNTVFSGTFITRGTAKGIVVATGSATEFGQIARMVKDTRKVLTPLQKKIASFTKTLMIAILVLGGLNLLLSYLFGFRFSYGFLASVSLIVAAIPEMLPMLVTSILALAAGAMARRHALIRRLPAAETLGSVTVICSDKTGTLTKNEMTVVKIHCDEADFAVTGVGYSPLGEFNMPDGKGPASNSVLSRTIEAGFLCNNSTLLNNQGVYEIVGDPTEGALTVAAAKAGLTSRPQRLDEIPFESEKMYMATLDEGPDSNVIYVKGSPEKITSLCQQRLTKAGPEAVRSRLLLEKADAMANEGLRVIALAYRDVARSQRTLETADIRDMVFLGFQGMIDPPRQEAIEAIEKCKQAGIRTVMITGDHVRTARAVARRMGILSDATEGALTGAELAHMSDDELYEAVATVSVYARVAPEHKLRIARMLQKRGHVVAMTGDGVNDAPALRAADIGIAMGGTGTEVSKEAAAMILTDDNFASIVAAVEEGRHAWNNLQKAILYTLPTNGGQALLIMGAILLAPFVALFALRLPLEPIQILWINLFDSVFLTMPLMMEPKEKGLLQEPPRSPKVRLADRLFGTRVGLVSLLMAAVGFFVFWNFGHLAVASDAIALSQAQTAAFMSVVLVHVGYVMTARSTHKSAFTFSPLTNRWLLGGIAITIVMNALIIYLPALNGVFRTQAFPLHWWPYVVMGLPLGFFVPELEKWLRRRRRAA